jgi:hypothetical protein
VLTLDELYRGVTSPPPRRRVREDAPEWRGEEMPAWMLDPADLVPDEASAPAGALHESRHPSAPHAGGHAP